MAPRALEAICRRGPFHASAETGCGGSTIVLSHISQKHTAFAIEGEWKTISSLRLSADLSGQDVTFVEGESRHTLPRYLFSEPIQLALLDGPHAYPQPQMEFLYLFQNLEPGGWLVLDDIQIRSVHELFSFLKGERLVLLDEVAGRTAFFRKTDATILGPDGWQQQRYNHWPVLRWCWRDVLRRWLRGR